MDVYLLAVLLWVELVELIESHYPKGVRGLLLL